MNYTLIDFVSILGFVSSCLFLCMAAYRYFQAWNELKTATKLREEAEQLLRRATFYANETMYFERDYPYPDEEK